ncbi:MAG: hypothetical protein ACLFPQ_01390 [Candidatus Woesearchaeota archaeon]
MGKNNTSKNKKSVNSSSSAVKKNKTSKSRQYSKKNNSKTNSIDKAKKNQNYKNKKDKEINKMKAQVFSLDTIIGVVIFLVVFTIFFAILTKNTQQDTTEQLNQEAQVLLNKLTTTDDSSLSPGQDLAIVKGGRVVEERIPELLGKDYEELKASLGIKGDFCIFFEDRDGNIINISDITGRDDIIGLGNQKINISGVPCSMG